MKVSDYLRDNCCIMDLKSTGKEDAIKEIAQSLSQAGNVKKFDDFVAAVLEREKLGSTGIGHHIAIPHARTASVSGFVIGFGKSSEGVEFNAIDGQKVHIIFLMGTGPDELNTYLRLLAELSKLIMNASFRDQLTRAGSPAEVIKVIKDFETAR